MSDRSSADAAGPPVTPTWGRLRRAARLFVQPLEPDRARALADRWQQLDPRWHSPFQAYGRKMTGCGATIGAHPRCDFACTGCYLGDDANRTAPFPLEDVLSQLERTRAWTGPKGNVQITDGEVTLRPEAELIAILRRARELDLVPMLMTHGDSFRRRPGLLERLVVDGGLREVSIHVDITMRGRLGFKHAEREEDLMPLRAELAQIVRAARRSTGIALRCATTLTVARHNLAGVAAVVRWCAQERDVFRMVSLQPLAAVGRTLDGMEGVTPDELWAEVRRGLEGLSDDVGDGGPIHVGHPACNRVASFLCFDWGDRRPPRFVKTVRAGQAADRAFLEALHATGLMGVGYRDDAPLAGAARKVGAALRAWPFVLGPGSRFLRQRLRDAGLPLARVIADLVRRRLRVDGFSVVSHHFMGRAEIDTPLGQERLAACVFRVPVGDEMLSMCEVNLRGLREQIYATGSTRVSARAEFPVSSRLPAASAPPT